MLARVRHPNVVTVYGVDRHDGVVGLWMEFVDGLTLARVVATRGALDPREAALVGIDLCRAVAAVHKAGLVHRDIKAHNVMREGSGRIVLMDFGAGELRTERSGAGSAAGTPLYLAPELFDGAPATIGSDVYSMGVLLFHLVTRRYPVEGASLEQIAAAQARRERYRLSDLSPELPDSFSTIVERALDRDPARRYRTCDEMQRDLMDAAQQVRVTAGSRHSARSIGTNRVAGRPAVRESRPRSRCRVPLQRPGGRTARPALAKCPVFASSRGRRRPMPPARKRTYATSADASASMP